MPATLMLRGQCCDCSYVWDLIAFPCEQDAAHAALGNAYCALCGNHQGNTLLDTRPLDVAEKQALLAVRVAAED